MAAHPDVIINLAASADTRGSSAYNRRLAIRRMNAVNTHLLSIGISQDRIVREEAAAGESNAQGSQDPRTQSTRVE